MSPAPASGLGNESAVVDLRSDTVTQPTAAMRRAMARADVGDDVYGEDPTARRLEESAAERVGSAAALFVPSGTMGNQIALFLYGRPGEELVCDADCHVARYEMGAMAALSRLVPRFVPVVAGRHSASAVEAALFSGDGLTSRTAAILVENTHNVAGGRVSPPALTESLVEVARRHQLPIHLDGARIFNAATALDVDVRRLTAGFDSVMFCLSKGLGAPVGSILCGDSDWIAEARRVRKMLGGGMRQVGVLAAAGLVALDEGASRLAEDHENAVRLARGLADLPGLDVDPESVESNIVVVGLEGERLGLAERGAALTERALAALSRLGVRAGPWPGGRLRFVTHRDTSRRDVERAAARIRRAVGDGL